MLFRSGVQTPEDTGKICEVAHAAGASVHMDGARIFNAAVALEVPAAELVKDVDDVSFCLSKGLSCPVGSVICGSREFIEQARRWRKMVGGGMRQAGVLAAAGLVALDTMIDRLAEDHANARLLAQGLANIDGLQVDPESIQTNIVIFQVYIRPPGYLTLSQPLGVGDPLDAARVLYTGKIQN